MDTIGWIVLVIVSVIFIVPGIFLINGKGSFLIAGYNTMSPEKKIKYDEKALCKVTGWLLILYSIGFAFGIIAFIYELMTLGGIILLLVNVALVAAIIYINTGNRFYHKDYKSLQENITPEYREKVSKTKKIIVIITVGISVLSFIGVLILYNLS